VAAKVLNVVALLILIASVSLLPAQEIGHWTDLKLERKVQPKYTQEAWDARLQGEVMLSAVIGVDGVPAEIKVLEKLGKGLDEKAVEALRQWRFTPATDRGEPVPSKVKVAMNFRMIDRNQIEK